MKKVVSVDGEKTWTQYFITYKPVRDSGKALPALGYSDDPDVVNMVPKVKVQ